MKTLKLASLVACTLLLTANCKGQKINMKQIKKNNMQVSWHYQNDRIFFKMIAPTDGWITIGFNTSAGTAGAYLLMGHVVKGKAEVVEHYTTSPGNYNPITKFGATAQVKDAYGKQNGEHTSIGFSLPVHANSKYQRNLTEGLEYIMLIAYSQEDDFQHHSIMRTSVKIKL